MGLFGRKSNDGPRAEVKQVTIDTGSQEGAVELVKLQEEGWEIVSQQKRGPSSGSRDRPTSCSRGTVLTDVTVILPSPNKTGSGARPHGTHSDA